MMLPALKAEMLPYLVVVLFYLNANFFLSI